MREMNRLKDLPGLFPETLALIEAALKTQSGAADLEGAVAEIATLEPSALTSSARHG